MIFARYKGAAKNGFTPGRTYVSNAELDSPSVVFSGFVEIIDDHGVTVRVDPEKEQFEYLSEVYVVVVNEFEGYKRGSVLVVDDADEDRVKFNVQGYGYRAASDLVILDGTNVFPGVVACDESTGEWKKLLRVDEALWVMPEGGSVMRSPEEFTFAVSDEDGELMMEPLVTCVETFNFGLVTKGKRYYLMVTNRGLGMVTIVNDAGVLEMYNADRFRMG